jgi:hypothetical protein
MMVKTISAINGIENVITESYSIRITKGEAFSWDELTPLIDRQIEMYQESLGGSVNP